MSRPAGRHRAYGRHRAPVQAHPRRRLAVVCGCVLCAAVIPLFAQHTPTSNPPDPTSTPTLAVVAPVVATPPTFTLQPRVDTVDMVSAVTGELAKHHDTPDDDTEADSPKSDKSENQKAGKSEGQDTSSDSTSDTWSHSRKPSGDPTPPACR